MNAQTDFYFRNDGSIFVLIPNTQTAREWTDENLHVESWQRFGENIFIDHRSFVPILEGVESDGLVIEEL